MQAQVLEQAKKMRLDAYLSRAGLGTRKAVKGLIRCGSVTVDGVPCRDGSQIITQEQVLVDGRLVLAPFAHPVLLLNKPVGYACSRNPTESPLVFELLPEPYGQRDYQPAGRLDRNTSGLLVFSNSGRWIHRLTHPGRKLPKRYEFSYEGTLTEDAVVRCAEGLFLPDDEQPTLPSELKILANARAELTLFEGRNHQVRRMAAALGVRVVALHRAQIGGLLIPDDLGKGACRSATDAELVALLQGA